ncbi:MAG: hypothetical protein ABJB05_09240 [Parafilimonas sp.]
MHIKFENSRKDFDFLKSYYLKKDLYKRLLVLIALSLFVAISKDVDQPFILFNFILKFIIAAIVFLFVFSLIPYLISKIKFQKDFKTKSLNELQTINLKEDGIDINTKEEKLFWRWETLNKADIIDEYLFFTLFTNKIYIIPLKFFSSNNEAINFLGIIRNGILKVKGQSRERKIRNLYYWGLVGFLPNFGVIAGIILIVKGFKYNNTNLVLIGSADILFTAVFWTIIFPFLTPI